ncbi:MAG: FtsX-like permease family protein [Treponema sp.]|jgi:putative ABC transport system permease protein|nr:FtsX-like permease family protein [Treponema sp.]
MTIKPLHTGVIAARNLRRRPFRTACLTVVVSIVSFTLFGASILTVSLRNGMDRMVERFGADLMVVPAEYARAAEAVLLKGEPQSFYINNAVVNTISSIDGINRISPQFFLTSIEDECCSLPVQIIGFDPDTDFVIQPWIAEVRSSGIADGQIVVGSQVYAQKGNIKFFDENYPVAAQLRATSTGLDSSVFMNMKTLKDLIAAAHSKNYHFLADSAGSDPVSSILIKLDKETNPKKIIREIKEANPGVEVISSSNIVAGIVESLKALTAYIRSFSVILWILSVVVLAAVFSGTINERKKEFAVFRVLGATRKKLTSIVLCESALTGIAGGIIGIVLASLVLFPFSAYIGVRLQLPFIQPGGIAVIANIGLSLALSFIIGPLASIYGAIKISRAETYYTLREGE